MMDLETKMYSIVEQLYDSSNFITKPRRSSIDDIRQYLSSLFFPRMHKKKGQIVFNKAVLHPSLTYLVDDKNNLIDWRNQNAKAFAEKLNKFSKINDDVLSGVKFDIDKPLVAFINVSFHYYDYVNMTPIKPFISVQKWLPYKFSLHHDSIITPELCYLEKATVWFLDNNIVRQTITDFHSFNRQPTDTFYVSARWKDINVYDDFDMTNGAIFKNVKQMQAVYDFKKQLNQYQKLFNGKPIKENIVNLPNLRYKSVLDNQDSMQKALLANWKRFETLIGKISFTKNTALEIYCLKQIQMITTDDEFNKVYNWFTQNKSLFRQNWDNLQELIVEYCVSPNYLNKAYSWLIYIVYLWQRFNKFIILNV